VTPQGDGPGGEAARALRARLLARSGLSAEIVTQARLDALLAGRARELASGGEGAPASIGGKADAAAAIALADDGEFARIEAHFTPPETWLFRYPQSFGRLRAFAEERGAVPLRVLVLGAGGWSEPISLAAALAQRASSTASTGVRIIATDRNPAVFARPPRFAGLDLRGGVPDWAARCFEADGAALVPAPHVSAMVHASCGDAIEIATPLIGRGERFDVVVFRNVAIYLGAAARAAIYGAIARLIVDDGLLLVGHAELSMAHSATGFAVDDADGAFALRAGAGQRRSTPGAVATEHASGAPPQSLRASVPPATRPPAPLSPASPQRPAAPAQPWNTSSQPPAAARGASDIRAALLAAIAARPLDAAAHRALAAHDLGAGAVAAASEAIARALYLDRGSEEALLLAATIADARGATAEAEAYRRRALRAHLAQPQGGDGA
jgi:chemotaxis protein methyltransferase CheR